MFIKLLVGPAASGKSTYIQNHKSEDDIIGFTIFDKLIIEDQHIAYKIQKLTYKYVQLEDDRNIKHLVKDDFNGKTFKRISGIYQQLFDKEVTMWIESKTISEEDIELLRNSYKHRFELIRFERTEL
jgi:hypothetical protein